MASFASSATTGGTRKLPGPITTLCARYSLPSTTSLPRGLCLCHMFSGVVNIISLHLQLRLNTSEYRWIWEEGSEIVATP